MVIFDKSKKINIISVSYTHLDVYKRQIEMIVQAPLSAQLAMVYLAFFSSALGFVFWSYAFEHAEKVSDVTNFMYISPIVAAIVAVSYTHLDVYKRQP